MVQTLRETHMHAQVLHRQFCSNPSQSAEGWTFGKRDDRSSD